MSMPHAVLLSSMFAVVAALWIAAAHLDSFWLGLVALVASMVWLKLFDYIFEK